ncbi:XK-related protein 6-like isoform X2 [Mya arenaria]|nr:XK-related protein 6-like isoform X2 [Mya arenaria]
MIMDIGWLIIDYKRARKTETRTVKTNRATESDDATRNEDWSENQTSEETNIIWPENPDKYNLVLRIVVTVMTVGAGGSVCRTIQYTYYFVKSELACTIDRHDEFKKRARRMEIDCLMMNFMEAFLESAPQFALQLYITYAFDRNFTTLRVLNLVTSALSITWSYSAYYRCNGANVNNKEDVKLIPFLIYILSVVSCIVPRFISFVLFAVYFETAGKITVLGVFGIHVFVGFLVIAAKVKPKLNGTVEYLVFRWLFYAFFAYVTFFLFLNLEHHRISETSNDEEANNIRNWFEEKKTKRMMILLYAFIHLENLILASLLVSCRLDLMADGFFVLIVVLIGAVVQLICVSSYYYFFHKTRTSQNAG